MSKHLHLFLMLFMFSGLVNAQSGPLSTANWFGYILPPSPAANKYITFTMQNLNSVFYASDDIAAVTTATFADGYVWSVNNDNGYNICKSTFNTANNFIGTPEVMVAGLPYINDMSYNPADGLIYIIINEHLKSFDPANPSDMQDHGVIEHDGFNLAINMDGNAYMISSWGEFGLLNLSNAQLTVISPIDLPIKMSFDMLTGELFGTYYGNLYQIDTNTGSYTNLGALTDGSNSYDPTCLFMTYGSGSDSFTVDNLNYQINPDGVSVTLIGHVDGYSATGALNIPASVSHDGHDYAVTTIGNSAFLYYYYLTSLTIPNSVTTIEDGAFAYCSGFTGDLIIPNSVITIGSGAFFQCSGFDGTLTIGESVKFIGDYAFRQCSNFTGAVTLATTPPELGNEPGWNCVVFEQFGCQVLTVPCECAEAYQNSAWHDPLGLNGFYEFIEDCSAVSEVENVISAIYPNPTKGIVKIEAESIRNISIYNTLGQEIFSTSASGDAFEYDFSQQGTGLYLIKVETANGVETKQVTVL
jgi:hypothetical protein